MNGSRRTFCKSVMGVAGGVAAGIRADAAPPHSRDAPPKFALTNRPNILYINSHDTGRYTSPYGYKVPTPNIHKLASEGICFTQAHCAAPTCSASRASLLTGQCPHSNGMFGLVNRGFSLNNYQHHILHTLRREADYFSALIGLQHIAADPTLIGYDHMETFAGNHVEEVTPAAVRFLHSHPKEPFWLEIGYFETHRPYPPSTPDDAERYARPPEPIPDVEPTRKDMADFHVSVSKLDDGIGEVLAALHEVGLDSNTLVISATDHGIAFPEMKTSLYDAGTGVHLVVRGPGGFAGGRVCDALLSHLDLFPTICDLLGIPHPDWLQGKSFLPVIRGERDDINEEIHAELNFHAAYEPKRSVRTKRWKYIRRYSNYTHPILPNCDDGLSKQYWVENGWALQVVPSEELFDLTFDPNERRNLAAVGAYQDILMQMRQRLQIWMESTSDPLLQGPIKAPPGARLNSPDQLSPKDPPVIVF